MKNDFKVGDWIIREWLDDTGDIDVFQISGFTPGFVEIDGSKYFRNGKVLPYHEEEPIETVEYPDNRVKDRLALLNEIPTQFRPKITITKQQKEQLIKTIKEI